MSVNIDHPNEDISTSAGSPPSLGSQAPLVANDATVTPNSSGNVARYVMTTATGGTLTENGANTWCKVATVTPGAGTFEYCSLTLRVQGTYNSTPKASSCTASISITQGTAGLSATFSGIYVESLNEETALSNDSFKLVSAATTNGTAIELWMQKKIVYGKFYIYELAKANFSNWSISYNDAAAWQSTTPTGAVTVTSDWAKPTRVAWTPVVEGETTAGTATYTTQVGYYWYKDGFIEFILAVTWSGHTGTGNMRISGLTKNSAAGTFTALSINVGAAGTSFTSWPAAIINNGDSNILLYDGTAREAVDAAGTLIISGRYAA